MATPEKLSIGTLKHKAGPTCARQMTSWLGLGKFPEHIQTLYG